MILIKNPKIFIAKYFEEYNKQEVFFEDTEEIIEKIYNKNIIICMLSKNIQNRNILETDEHNNQTKQFVKYISSVCIAEKNSMKYFLYRSFIKKSNVFDTEVVVIGDNFADDVLPAILLGTKVVWCNKYNSKLKKYMISFLKLFSKKVLDESEIKKL